MLNFRDQQEEGSVLKLVETDSTRQILKLIDQLYVPYLNDNIAKITDNGQQYKKNWQQRHWRSVFFSDESRFCFDFHNGRRLVSRSKGKRYADCWISEHDKFRDGSLVVLSGISVDYKTNLSVIEGSLTVLNSEMIFFI